MSQKEEDEDGEIETFNSDEEHDDQELLNLMLEHVRRCTEDPEPTLFDDDLFAQLAVFLGNIFYAIRYRGRLIFRKNYELGIDGPYSKEGREHIKPHLKAIPEDNRFGFVGAWCEIFSVTIKAMRSISPVDYTTRLNEELKKLPTIANLPLGAFIPWDSTISDIKNSDNPVIRQLYDSYQKADKERMEKNRLAMEKFIVDFGIMEANWKTEDDNHDG